MSVRLKPLENQTIVLTGATSGIGLSTARLASERGARLVIAARNEDALSELSNELRGRGTQVLTVTADVGDEHDVKRIAQAAIERFGGFDTWINNAGVSIYGAVEEVPVADQRRLFDTNYWGVVYGSRTAAEHLRRRGGAIINLGSVLSDRAMILQGPYSASKHAVKGFTDALRMELEVDNAPISVTLIKPSAIDTPYMEHARNYMDSPGTKNPPPSYDPSLVAEAILYACEQPKRDIVIGAGGYAISIGGRLFPRLMDYAMELTGYATQSTDDPGKPSRRDNLYEPREDGAEHPSFTGGPDRTTSLFLRAQMNPLLTTGLAAAAGLAIAVMGRGWRRSQDEEPRHRQRDDFMRRRRPSGDPSTFARPPASARDHERPGRLYL